MKHLRKFLLPLLGGLLAPLLHGQTDEPTFPYRLEFRIYPYGNGDFSGLFYQASPLDAPVEMAVFRGRESPPYEYEGAGALVLYRKTAEVPAVDPENPDPTAGFREVARMTFGAASAERLVFLTPGSGDGNGSGPEFNLSDMPAFADAVEKDHLAFFNGTGARLAGIVGDTKVVLGPGLSEQVSLTDYFDRNKVLVGLVVQYEDSVRVVLENRARFLPDRRNLFVLMPPERKNSFEIVAFRLDQLELPPSEATPEE